MSEHQFSFEKLDVWKSAKEFAIQIFKITERFPEKEKYGIRSQIARAALSVASNIAEGSSRTGTKDQAYFMQLAYSSLMETTCQLLIARDLGYISSDKYSELRRIIEEISNKLNALRKYYLTN